MIHLHIIYIEDIYESIVFYTSGLVARSSVLENVVPEKPLALFSS